MAPPSKKSKDTRAASKPTSNANSGVPASGYNPLLGTFHTLDTAPISSAPTVHINGKNRNIDESEDHNGNFTGNTGVEYDNISNNGSWSGESEDHKDKTSQPSIATIIATATNTGVDNDKREKIRQKNEKKHQRQKERRAQELHEKCSGYLMSRKLESLSQQLVAMGFSSERATMALILNEGRVEQSVAWLFEGGEDSDNNHENNNDNNNLKIDISEELARVAEMEIRFKCSKQEVERAVVACEGDLEQAAETLKAQKHEQPPPAVPPKVEETGGSSRMVSKAIAIQKKTDGDNKDFDYTKTGGPVTVTVEPGVKNVQLLKKTPPVEKRWPVAVSGGSTSNPSLASPLQAAPPPPPPPAKTEPRYTSIGIELKNIQLGSVREPVIMMQRPKSKNVAAMSASVADLHPNAVEPVMNMNVNNSNGFSHGPVTTRGYNSINSNTSGYGNLVNNSQIYDAFGYQQQQQQVPIAQHYATDNNHFNQHFNNGGGGGMWNGSVGPTITPTLAAASSLGLFSGSTGPSSPADWNTCDSFCDYKNIDWSLDRLPHPATSPSHGVNGMWMGYRSSTNSAADIYASGMGGGGTTTRPPAGILPNGGAVGSEVSAGGSREWSSPFEEKELFSFPRQFVSSPSL